MLRRLPVVLVSVVLALPAGTPSATAHGPAAPAAVPAAVSGTWSTNPSMPTARTYLAAAAVNAGFGAAGERCMSVSALVAVDPVGDEQGFVLGVETGV